MLNKKIKKLLIGTNNKGKLKEIRALLPKNVKTLSTSYFKLNSPKEYGKTFIENSIIKSKFFSKKANLICLADDSGLEIDLLSKKPGIYSARWAGKKSNFNKAILEMNIKDNLHIYSPKFQKILENIENNDPMAVYKEMGEFNMMLGITINNIMCWFTL